MLPSRFTNDVNVSRDRNSVIELCRPYGTISEIVVKPDRGTAFVSFQTLENAEVAIYRLHSMSRT
jgi:hypothetical protein